MPKARRKTAEDAADYVPLTAAGLIAWRERLGLSQRAAAAALGCARQTMAVRVRPDQARMDREAFTTNQSLLDASAHCRLGQLAQEITVAEAVVCLPSAPMRQNLRIEQGRIFWLIVALGGSEDETEIRAGKSAGGTGRKGYSPGDPATFFGRR